MSLNTRHLSPGTKSARRSLLPCLLAFLSLTVLTAALSAQPAAPATMPFVPMLPNGAMDFGIDGWVIPEPPKRNINRPRTVQLLAEAITQSQLLPHRRAQLITEIGQCQLPTDGTPAIELSLGDPDPIVRASAASAAVENGDPAVLPSLGRLAGKDDIPEVRRTALVAYGRLAGQTPTAAAVIAAALGDSDPNVVEAALTLAFTPEHAASIAASASRPASLIALGRIGHATGDTRHADVVAASLKGNVPLRVAAVRALARMHAASRKADVVSALRDPHPSVRREAILTTGDLIDPPQRYHLAIAMLTGEQADPDLSVREAAVRILTPCPGSSAADAIAANLGEPYRPLRQAARDALTHPANDSVKQVVIDLAVAMLDSSSPPRQEDGSYVLGRLRSTAGWEKHLALLDPKDISTPKVQWIVIRQAVESMGWIGDPRSGDALLKVATEASGGLKLDRGDAMRGTPGDIVPAALIACGRVGHKPATDMCNTILKGNPEQQASDLRAAAAFVLYRVAEPGSPPPGIFSSGINDPREADVTRIEFLKGIGVLRAKSAVGALTRIEAKERPPISFVAHWALERIQNKTYPYAPRPEDWRANTSIEDLTGP